MTHGENHREVAVQAEWGTCEGPEAEAEAPEGLWEPGVNGWAEGEQTRG